jgi:NADH-quinone oxidoreductase subunit J
VHDNRKALGIAVVTFLLLGGGALFVPWPARRSPVGADTTVALGQALMGSKMLVMVAVSPVMVATLVAAVALASSRSRYDRLGDDLRSRPADDPHPGGVGR